MTSLKRLPRAAVTGAVMVLLVAGAVPQASIAQDSTDQDGAVQAEEAYTPTNFLRVMVQHRRLALTCDEVLPTSPAAATQGISDFFTDLDQPSPDSTFPPLERTIDLLVRSHGASICQDKLDISLRAYRRAAAEYDAKKPAEWPMAPVLGAGPWCATRSCQELQ